MKQETTQPIEKRVRMLERRLYLAYLIIVIAILVQIGSFDSSPAQASSESNESAQKIIKTRGIIIVDEQGRERILLGAPIPAAKNRVRTDLTRVKEIWGKRYPNPDQYLKNYKTYNHQTNGLLILDENGFDRIALGDPKPDSNIGRIAPSTGMQINDEKGDERSGYGLMKLKDGTYRVGLGLDSFKGESINLFVDEKDRRVGNVGIRIKDDKNQSIFLGSSSPNNPITKLPDAFSGLLIKNGDEVKHQFNTLEKK